MRSKFTLETQQDEIVKLVEAIGSDGHTIWKADVLAAFPVELQKRFVRKYESDGTAKGSLSTNDGPVNSLTGVYGLSVLYGLASDLGVEYESAMGRGTQARHLTFALRQKLGMQP